MDKLYQETCGTTIPVKTYQMAYIVNAYGDLAPITTRRLLHANKGGSKLVPIMLHHLNNNALNQEINFMITNTPLKVTSFLLQ